MYKNLAATLVAACFFVSAAQAQISAPTPKPSTEPIKAGFVYVSPITEAGKHRWMHELKACFQGFAGQD